MPKVIDTHAHYVSPELIKEVRRNGARYGLSISESEAGSDQLKYVKGAQLRPFFPELCDLEIRRPFLERSGIDHQILSTWTDMAGDVLEPAEAARWARLQNETLADDARRYADTFTAMGTLPLQNVVASCQELDHIVSQLGIRSIELSTNINGRDLDGPEYRPLWKRIRDLDVFVLLHPGFVTISPERLGKYFLNNLIGFPVDTTIAAARLMFSGLFDEIPGLKVCLAHSGGFLPYQIGRMDRGFAAHPACQATLRTQPSTVLSHFFFDTLTHGTDALKFLFDTVDAERILYGSDYPFEMLDPVGPSRVNDVPGLTERQKTAVLYRNAKTVLGLTGAGLPIRVARRAFDEA